MPPKGDLLWVDARHNKGSIPANTNAIDVATAILNALPNALIRTVFSKTDSRRISKLFGISSLLKPIFRKVEEKNNLEPLEDLIVTSYWFKDNLFLLFSGVASEPSEEAISDISALAMMYLKLWKEELLSIDKTKVESIYLSDIELEVLKWAAAGKSLKDIAEITGIKYRTVRYHLETARDKYGYATIQQTIVRASLDYGLSPLGGDEKNKQP